MRVSTSCIIALKERQFIHPMLWNIIEITLNVSKVTRSEYVHDVVLDRVSKKQTDVREGFLSEVNEKGMRRDFV